MNGETSFKDIVNLILSISFILTIFTSAYLVTAVVYNDYIVYELQVFIEDFNADGYLPDQAVTASDQLGEEWQQWIYNANRIFILMYVLFFMETVLMSYFVKSLNYISFFTILFYGSMILLFVLSIFLNLSKWFLNDFLVKLIPPALSIIPSFAWFLNYAGIILFIQMMICMLVNQLDFDLVSIISRKKKEQSVLSESEI